MLIKFRLIANSSEIFHHKAHEENEEEDHHKVIALTGFASSSTNYRHIFHLNQHKFSTKIFLRRSQPFNMKRFFA